ncbi:MAG: mycofactocin precursor [Actinobacteria bacterium]|nr:mycofactocin precursor [Actinomycetota bacterium]
MDRPITPATTTRDTPLPTSTDAVNAVTDHDVTDHDVTDHDVTDHDVIDDDLLVEEISIDGMCGVY